MEQFLLTAAASFAGAIFALVAVRFANAPARSGPPRPVETSAKHKTARLAAAGAFAVVTALIVTFISDGELAAGLGGILALTTLAVLTFAVRTVR